MKGKTPITTVFLVLTAITGAAGLMAGCHGSHEMMAARERGACPDCRLAAQTTQGAGMSHATCACPSCRDTSTLDESMRAALERYVGGQTGDAAHVCARCEAIDMNT